MEAYEATYRYFRDNLIHPVLQEELPDPILTFSRGKSADRASFAPDAWQADLNQNEKRCELALTPEHTADSPREVMASLVHEMAHYLDHLAGTAPKSAGYHGRKWFERMEKLGLPAIQKSPKSRVAVTHRILSGGAYAKAYDALPKSILLPFVAALEGRSPPDDEDIEKAEKPATKAGKRCKYLCPRCQTSMRGPFGRKLICGDCDVPYEAEEMPAVDRILTSEKDKATAT